MQCARCSTTATHFSPYWGLWLCGNPICENVWTWVGRQVRCLSHDAPMRGERCTASMAYGTPCEPEEV